MKKIAIATMFGAAVLAGPNAQAEPPALAPNGISQPVGWQDWRILAPSVRSDNNTIRIILGNDKAIEAARAGQIKPWPDGAVIAKVVWANKELEAWPAATVPGQFKAVEFMIKDSKQFASTLGWGFARWLGQARKPYGKDADFAQECVDCHMPMADKDYVFTAPIELPPQ